MGFFDDLKQDLSMAVGELLPDEATSGEETIDLAAADQEELDRILASSGIYTKESESAEEIQDPVTPGTSDEELLAELLKGLPDLPEEGSAPTEEKVDLSDVEDLLGELPSVDELLAGLNAEAGLTLSAGAEIPSEDAAVEEAVAEAVAVEADTLLTEEESLPEVTEEPAENLPSVEEILAGLNLEAEMPAEDAAVEEAAAEAVAAEADTLLTETAPLPEVTEEPAENLPSVEEILAGLNLEAEMPTEDAAVEEAAAEAVAVEADTLLTETDPLPEVTEEPAESLPSVEEMLAGLNLEAEMPAEDAAVEEAAAEEATAEEPAAEEPAEEPMQPYENQGVSMMSEEPRIPKDSLALITEGMNVSGDIKAEGNLELQGRVGGNLDVWGKLTVTGTLIGNAKAKEVYAENARITGDIFSETSVKLGSGSVVVGNITAFSAAIAGAVRGDIDVHGPVILDSTAVVLGNIRSKSIQINNGAMVEGMCSQCYADISPSAFFDTLMKTGTRPEM